MAKRKSKKKTTTRRRSRRSRVSGIGTMDIKELGLAIVGAFAAAKLKQVLSKDPTKTTMNNLAPFAGIAAGLLLPMVSKSPMVKALSLGMVAQGGVDAVKKLAPSLVAGIPVLSGYTPTGSGGSNRFRTLPKVSVNGMGNYTPNSAYSSAMSVVNGVPGAYNPAGSGAAYSG